MKPKHFLATSSIGIILSFAPGITSCNSDIDAPNFPTENEKTVSMSETKAVSKADALDVAAIFNAGRFGGPVNRSSQNVETITNQVGHPIAYVVNNDEGGWVIVSATTDYHPILAYSDSGTFDIQGIEKTGVSVWINEINSDIEASASFCNELTTEISAEWYEFTSQFGAETMASGLPTGNSPEAVKCRARLKELNDAYYKDGWTFTTLPNVTGITLPNDVYTTADNLGTGYEYTIVGLKDKKEQSQVGPFLTTQWSQYGYATNSPSGCVPVAIAQIMRFYQYPSYFEWYSMDNTEKSQSIRVLIDDIVRILGMTDDISNNLEAIKAFNHYGYSATLKQHNNQDVINDLYLSRPIYMSGKDEKSSSGHAWVCDGLLTTNTEHKYYVEYLNIENEYTNYGLTSLNNPSSCGYSSRNDFHMNWGDGGDQDGWYVNPTVYEGEKLSYNYVINRKNIYINR